MKHDHGPPSATNQRTFEHQPCAARAAPETRQLTSAVPTAFDTASLVNQSSPYIDSAGGACHPGEHSRESFVRGAAAHDPRRADARAVAAPPGPEARGELSVVRKVRPECFRQGLSRRHAPARASGIGRDRGTAGPHRARVPRRNAQRAARGARGESGVLVSEATLRRQLERMGITAERPPGLRATSRGRERGSGGLRP